MALQIQLPLNNCLNNYGLDVSQSITRFNLNTIFNKSKLYNETYLWIASSDAISLDGFMSTFGTYNTYSIAAWVYFNEPNEGHGHSQTICSSGNWNSAAKQLCFALNGYSGGGYTKILVPNTSGWSKGITLNEKLIPQTWYHLTITYDGEKTKLYINGRTNEKYIYNGGGITKTPDNNNLYIGKATYTTAFTLLGSITDFRIYDHCLSAREIYDISRGLLLHYKLTNQSETQQTILDNSICKNHGQINMPGMYRTNSVIHYDNYLHLIGNNYITCGRTPDGENVSASFWVKPESLPERAVVFADHSSGLAFGFYQTTKAIISCGSISSNVITGLDEYWEEGKWNHIVVVKNNNTFDCYLNGQKLIKSSSTNLWSHYIENTLIIGCRNNGTYNTFYTGGISDFRLYGTSLSEEAVKQLYQTPISLSNNYVLFSNELLEEDGATSSFLKTGTIKTNKIKDDGGKLHISSDTIQSADFIEW